MIKTTFCVRIIGKGLLDALGHNRWYWCGLFWVVWMGLLQAQPANFMGSNQSWLNLTQEDGLPSNEVYDLLQDSRGYIWIATDGGLARYDGVQLKHYVYDASTAGAVDLLKEDHYGHIWCKSYRGQIFYVENDSLRFFEPLKEAPKLFKFYDAFWFHPTEHYLVTTLDGEIYQYKAGQWSPWGQDISLSRSDCPDPVFYGDGDTILAIGRGPEFLLMTRQKKAIERTLLADTFNYYYSGHLIPTEDRRCFHFLRTKDSLLQCYRGRQLEPLTHLPNRARLGLLHKVWVEPQKAVSWLTSSTGLWRWDYTNPKQPTTQHFFPEQHASKFIRDREGNYWLATLNQGVFMVPQLGAITRLGYDEPLFQQSTFLIQAAVDSNHLWLTLDDGTLIYYHTPTGTAQGMYKDNTDKNTPLHIKELPDGKTVKVTYPSHYMFLRLPDLKLLRQHVRNKLQSRNLHYIDGVTLATGSTLGYALEGAREIKPIRAIRVYDLIQDFQQQDAFWVAFRDTLFYYPVFNTTPTPILDPYTKAPIVGRSMVQTEDGTLWVGTQQGQLYAIKDQTHVIGMYQPAQRYQSQLICRDLATDGRRLWMGTDKGLFCYIPNIRRWQYYGKLDGLISQQIRTLAWVNGALYAATPKGILKIDPTYNPTNTTAPLIRLNGLTINNRDTALYPQYSLAHNENNVTFLLEGIALRSQGQFTYAYRLLPSDSLWRSAPSNAPAINYSALPPGAYCFEAVAVNEDGIRSVAPVEVAFYIAVPYWERWWFRLLVAGVSGLLVLGVVWSRVRRIRQREREAAEARERMQNLRLSALQSQMNPHFVFNALSSIEFFILNGELKQALLYHDKLARLMRQTFEYSKKQQIPLEDELEFLALYLELENMRLDGQLEWDLQLSEEVDGECDEILIPPLLLQPLIENSFKHGLMHCTKEDKVLHVDFSILEQEQREYLWVRITDNGIGWRQAQQQQSAMQLPEHRSSGLAITRERLRLLNSETNGPPILTLIDRSDEGEQGTRVEVCIKLAYKHQNRMV